MFPKECGGVGVTANNNIINRISDVTQLPTPREDQALLDSLGKGRLFPPFSLLSSFHQVAAHANVTVPITTALHTGAGLYEWHAMLQGSSAPYQATHVSNHENLLNRQIWQGYSRRPILNLLHVCMLSLSFQG